MTFSVEPALRALEEHVAPIVDGLNSVVVGERVYDPARRRFREDDLVSHHATRPLSTRVLPSLLNSNYLRGILNHSDELKPPW